MFGLATKYHTKNRNTTNPTIVLITQYIQSIVLSDIAPAHFDKYAQAGLITTEVTSPERKQYPINAHKYFGLFICLIIPFCTERSHCAAGAFSDGRHECVVGRFFHPCS